MIRRTIREWERIGYGSDKETIPAPQADRIAAVARESSFSGNTGEGVLEHGRSWLRARGVVGIIATPDCQLEILPKIEGAGEREVGEDTLRRRLIDMLAVAWDIRLDAGAMTKLAWQRDTILELLIRLFCSRLADAVRQGIPRQYTNQEEDLPALRGRLDATRQCSVLAASPQKLACQFDGFSPDIPLNQAMRAAIGKLSRISQAPDNQRKLRELNFVYSDISDVPPGALRWDLIVLDRTNARWRELVSLARLFLHDRHQQTSTGTIDGHALLFEMNVLFERYVARLLAGAVTGTGMSVSVQGGHRDCLFEGATGRFRTLPDLIVRNGNQIALVADTKWKRISPRIDDLKQGVSQSDVYQMMAYGRIYDCQDIVLLYPHHGGLPPDPVRRRFSIAKPGANERLIVATLDISGSHEKIRAALKKLLSWIAETSTGRLRETCRSAVPANSSNFGTLPSGLPTANDSSCSTVVG